MSQANMDLRTCFETAFVEPSALINKLHPNRLADEYQFSCYSQDLVRLQAVETSKLRL